MKIQIENRKENREEIKRKGEKEGYNHPYNLYNNGRIFERTCVRCVIRGFASSFFPSSYFVPARWKEREKEPREENWLASSQWRAGLRRRPWGPLFRISLLE